jgi:hypothetical protein
MGPSISSSNEGMILFLDDAAERAAKFCEKLNSVEQSRTIWCKSSEEAIITIRDYHDRLTLMFLDHDLGVGEQNFKSPESGMEVIRYLEKNLLVTKSLLHNKCRIVVHTHNPPAGKIMLERLQDLGFSVVWTPFGM